MSDNDRDTLRRVAWSETCPWLAIFRTFRLAIGLRVLLLAAVGIFLTLSGWSLLGALFSVETPFEVELGEVGFPQELDRGAIPPDLRAQCADHYIFLSERASPSTEVKGTRWLIRDESRVYTLVREGTRLNVSPPYPDMGRWMRPHAGCPSLAIDEAVPDRPTLGGLGSRLQADPLAPTAWQALDPYFGTWVQLSQPLLEIGRGVPSLGKLACLLLCGLWAVAVWAFFGGAITRIAAVQLACEERVGWGAALRHAGSKWLSYFAAPLLPLLGILLAALPVVLVGFLLREQYVGVWLAALVWPLVLLAGLLIAMLALGLIFGWPLMWATISAEGTDSFDALSRCYAYVFGRPLHYLFYAVVAAVLGALGWLLVSNFAAGVIWVSYSAAGWGAGVDNVELIRLIREGQLGGAGWLIAVGWVGCVKLLAVGFIYGYFWTASTAIYFLLRRDVDATEMDEVFLEEDASEPSYGLPPLKTDEAGAPAVNEDVPEVEPDESRQSEEGA